MVTNGTKGRGMTTQLVAQGAIIAALYVVLSLMTYQFSYLEIQCRVAEALCMAIYFTPAGVWGVFVGCLITNMFSGSWMDIVFGSAATLIAALITRAMAVPMKKTNGNKLDFKHMLLLPIPTVVVNALVIPFVLYYGYGIVSMGSATAKWSVLGLMMFSIAAGEIISCYVFGPLIVKLMTSVETKLSFSRE